MAVYKRTKTTRNNNISQYVDFFSVFKSLKKILDYLNKNNNNVVWDL